MCGPLACLPKSVCDNDNFSMRVAHPHACGCIYVVHVQNPKSEQKNRKISNSSNPPTTCRAPAARPPPPDAAARLPPPQLLLLPQPLYPHGGWLSPLTCDHAVAGRMSPAAVRPSPPTVRPPADCHSPPHDHQPLLPRSGIE